MLNFLKGKKSLISFCLILAISSLAIFSLGVNEAKAVDLGIVDGLKSLLGGALLSIQEIIGGLVSWFAGLAQGILGYTDIKNAQMVKDGWKILRDLVNMFFVLVLLIIAFATILRFETYGIKTLLPKLIIAALLINFSLVLAGVVIDFSGVLTNFFIQDSTSFFDNIAGSMGLAKLQLTNAEQPSEYWDCDDVGDDYKYTNEASCIASCFLRTCSGPITPPAFDWSEIPGDKFWKVAASLFLSIIFTTIAAFVFAALAFLLLVRLIVIWFLLILAPLAWFFWILPSTKHLFEQWWKAFIKWVFFAPAAIFFIWLSVSSWVKFISGAAPSIGGEIIPGMKEVITDEITQAKIMPQVMLPENFIQFLLACGMLIGSLIVAQKIGITFADSAVSLSKKAAGGVGKWTGRKMLVNMPTVEKIGNKVRQGLAATRLDRVPIIKHADRPFQAYEGMNKANFAKEEEKYKNRTSDNLKATYRTADTQGKAAIASALATRGDLEANDKLGFRESDITKSVKLAERYGKHKDILKARPDLVGDDYEAIAKIISGITPGNLEKMQAEALNGETQGSKHVIAAIKNQLTQRTTEKNPNHGKWKSNHLSKLADLNPNLFFKIKSEVIDKEIISSEEQWKKVSQERPDIAKYLGGDAGKAVYGEEVWMEDRQKKEPEIVMNTSTIGKGKFSDEERAKMLKT